MGPCQPARCAAAQLSSPAVLHRRRQAMGAQAWVPQTPASDGAFLPALPVPCRCW